MKNIFLFFSKLIFLGIVLITGGCTKYNTEPSAAITGTQLQHSMKGYELYSWQADGQWCFKLITGTNRNKTVEEITSNNNLITGEGWVDIRVQGVEELKILLGRLPKNEYVFWVSPQWLKNAQGQPGPFEFPSLDVVDNIKEYCVQIGIDISVSV